MAIAENLNQLLHELPPKVQLVAVSKTMPVSAILEAYAAGQRDFGENRVQEMLEKEAQLPSDIRWHLIGHLQTNKVRMAIPGVYLIHSVDSLKLLETIETEAARIGRVVDCLLQIRIAREETKFGMQIEDAETLFRRAVTDNMPHVRIRGLMGMATFTDDESQVREEFGLLKSCFDRFRDQWFRQGDQFSILSMGMSGDYSLAVEAGSTLVRIGSLIFGSRT
jgi:PLP dependent protein